MPISYTHSNSLVLLSRDEYAKKEEYSLAFRRLGSYLTTYMWEQVEGFLPAFLFPRLPLQQYWAQVCWDVSCRPMSPGDVYLSLKRQHV